MFTIKNFTKKIGIFAVDILGILLIVVALLYDLFAGIDGFGKTQTLVLFSGIVITSIGSLWIGYHKPTVKFWLVRLPSLAAFAIGVIILGINVFGLFISLRNPDVYLGTHYAGKERKVLYSAPEVLADVNRIKEIDEQYPDYVKRLTRLIYNGTVHLWEYESDNAHSLRIPIHENFLIYAITLLDKDKNNYEFCNAERAISRAASVCSQSSKILADILGQNAVKAHIVGLGGHVVVLAKIDFPTNIKEWWVLDADYGVVIEHDLDEIESNPEIIRGFYERQGYNQGIIDNLVTIYGSEDNEIIEFDLQCDDEDHLYLLKWLIPLTSIFPFIFLILTRVLMINRQNQ